jgi:hypothetical protein
MTTEKPDAGPLPACGQQCDCHDRLNPGLHCSACDPTCDYDLTRYLEVTTRITADGQVYFGDEKLPGLIEQDGIVFRPGGPDGANRLTVTFLVGAVEAADPLAEYEAVIEDAPEPVRLPTRFDTPDGLAALLRHHGVRVEFDDDAPLPDTIARAIDNHDAWDR